MADSPSVILRRHGLRPKKAWGQNFLGDDHHLGAIAEACRIGADDTVVELGAGLGHLTRHLAATGARVVAVERDRDLVPILRADLEPLRNVEVREENAATIDLAALAAETGRKLVVVGNLPYHLSTEILFHVESQRDSVSRMVFLLQREVTERIAARPGGKEYGVLSVLLQLHADVDVPHRVPAGVFTPPPEVESAVVRLELREAPRADPGDEELFRRVVKGAFAQRRKTLVNSLRGGRIASPEILAAALERSGIDGGRRAETLAVEELAALARAIAQAG
ncbi:16S rRNA (adenine(1518)-N(6)/adenine(1519)-N(6))-dimethyltransferase RsmA [Vulgatibacter incomptus]|uniref:Ribosomal RNA small subunit methyltransferase A n=1 Tax=Vulgatibacter incomptus TaxID=1391653 RepID=A0A0K1PFC5_9BACT|nr:16S rRNA (adenine(1518)-N(6)/adenine(1519)-N(6))-dimethyltransferase RsmA [Vulgatibacter incomptus]AKU91819.1 SSU rRNA (adenine(1518)-N(6)/adenine(1519)-N(6))-dimethyltransferase [Vulgatibacter incomptus]